MKVHLIIQGSLSSKYFIQLWIFQCDRIYTWCLMITKVVPMSCNDYILSLLIFNRMSQERCKLQSEFGKMCTSWNKWHIRLGKWGEITRGDESIIFLSSSTFEVFSSIFIARITTTYCNTSNGLLNSYIWHCITLLWYHKNNNSVWKRRKKDLVSFIDIGEDVIKHRVISGILSVLVLGQYE